MDEAGVCIRQAYVHTLSLWQSPEERAAIHAWVVGFIAQRRAIQLATQEVLPQVRDEVFGRVLIRDFVLELQFQFFARWVGDLQKFTDLTHRLSQGMSTDAYQQGYTATPEALNSRLSSQEAAELVLRHNKWLVALLVLKLHIEIAMKP